MSDTAHFQYDDSYPTCVETYSTLRIFSDRLTPERITTILQIEATDQFSKGDRYSRGRLRRQANGWFYCTEALCASRDTRRHIDIILAVLDGKADSVDQLRREGCEIDIVTYWTSVGQGGPCLLPSQMATLGALGIGMWWDIYFDDETRSAGTNS